MDAHPWTYAVTTAEMRRERRIDPAAQPGSGSIVDPRQYVTIEACGETQDATFAFDVGLRSTGNAVVWYPTDTDSRFRLARSGCFRAGAPLPGIVSVSNVVGLRIRAYPRPPTDTASSAQQAPRVRLLAVTRVFMLDANFTPIVGPQSWEGSLQVPADQIPAEIPIGRRP
jgi:hypothetical protein